ncbi:hypothetical protein GCM10018783_47500 [Streptomyces griseosporeus]|nr:hypothetical protein GCM10018783_47500 [Streptomyces griseosporeus]
MRPAETARGGGASRGGPFGAGEPTRGGATHPAPAYPFFAFAAAFISCLCARTFVRESGPVMSAIERWEPGSP